MLQILIFFAPLIVCTLGNTLYNVIGKSIPSQANSFATLTITYATGFVICVILFFVTNPGGSIFEAVMQANWASYFLGFTIVFIDLSLILLYRAGWDISIGTLVANIGMSVLLVPVGVTIWHEGMTMQKGIGILVCLIGLYIVNAPRKRKDAEGGETFEATETPVVLDVTDGSAGPKDGDASVGVPAE
jgi:drug/metabolite transporter (DMT)-like permease